MSCLYEQLLRERMMGRMSCPPSAAMREPEREPDRPADWHPIDDESYARKSIDEMTPEELAHAEQHYPDILDKARAQQTYVGVPFADMSPTQRAAFRYAEPGVYEQHRAEHGRTASWARKTYAQLSPAERAAFQRSDPASYAAEKARHEHAAASIAREPWKYLQFHELSGLQKAAYKQAEPAAYARARAAAGLA